MQLSPKFTCVLVDEIWELPHGGYAHGVGTRETELHQVPATFRDELPGDGRGAFSLGHPDLLSFCTSSDGLQLHVTVVLQNRKHSI